LKEVMISSLEYLDREVKGKARNRKEERAAERTRRKEKQREKNSSQLECL